MKAYRWNGRRYEEMSGGGGGGSSHTHPNLNLLNSITSAMVNGWNTASSWVSSNGTEVLNHISNALLHLPSGGVAGQILKKTTNGTTWANESGGGGGSFNGLTYRGSATVKSGSTLVFSVNDGETAIVLKGVYSSHAYTAIFPLSMFDSSGTTCAIALSSTYLEVKIAVDSGVVTVSRTSTSGYTIEAWSF